MQIIRKALYDLKWPRLLAAREEEYKGEIAYAKGEAKTEVVPTGPFEPQIPYIQDLFKQAGSLLHTGASNNIVSPQYFPESTVAQPPQSLTNNQNSILDFITRQQPVNQGVVNTAVGAANTAGNNAANATATPLIPNVQQSLLALLSGQNPSLAFGQGGAQGVGEALTGILGGAGAPAGLNTTGAPTGPLGGINAAGELQTSLEGGSLNPFLNALVTAATRSAGRVFQDTTLPGIRQEAVQAGQRGGSRQGIAEGIAASRFGEDVADITTRIFADAANRASAERGQALGIIGQNALNVPQVALDTARINEATASGAANRGLTASDLVLRQLLGGSQIASGNVGTGTAQVGDLLTTGGAQAQNQLFGALGLIPQLQANQLAQFSAGNQVGLQQQAQGQANIDDLVSRFFFEQFAPYAALSQFQNFVTGNYGSSV